MGTDARTNDVMTEEERQTRCAITTLIWDARSYHSSKEFFEILRFVSRLRYMAPFNALLLQIQKPGLLFAATASDWLKRFNRHVKPGARPLIILWPLSPVALVYDLEDTEGDPVPEDVMAFKAEGSVTRATMDTIVARLARNHIDTTFADGGTGLAGYIEISGFDATAKRRPVERYRVTLNRNHDAAVQFATMAHELAHLFLGHLGENKLWQVPDRRLAHESLRELEAEAVAFIVCKRHGVTPNSHKYLADHVAALDSAASMDVPLAARTPGMARARFRVETLDLYEITRAAGDVEEMLGLAPTIEVKEGIDTLGLSRRRRKRPEDKAPAGEEEDSEPIGGARSVLAGAAALD